MQRLVAITIAGLLLAGPVRAAVPGPAVPAGAKCPVCGMFVARYPNWTATLTFRDNSVHYYDGAKDLFSHLLDPGRYTPGRAPADVGAVTVREYYGLKQIDARGAWYVIGSDVRGPMGAELIPFASEKDARSFLLDHKGKRVVRFTDITPNLLKTLR